MMTHDYMKPESIRAQQNRVFHPTASSARPWEDVTTNTRFYVNLPCYPFRTLSSRSAAMMQPVKSSTSPSFLTGGGGGGMDFEYASCLLPAHTQLTLVLKRRDKNLLDFMLPHRLTGVNGSTRSQLTEEERNQILTFVKSTRATAAAAAASDTTTTTGGKESVNAIITRVEIVIDKMVLQVFKKNF